MTTGGNTHTTTFVDDFMFLPSEEEDATTSSLTKLQEELVYAIETHNTNSFKDLGGVTMADLNFECQEDGMVPLMIAAAKGSAQFIQLMLQNPRIDINKTDNFGVNSFWIAAYYGNAAAMAVLAEAGIDTLSSNENGTNALHLAAKSDYRQITKLLLQSLYPLDIQKTNGTTALGIALS